MKHDITDVLVLKTFDQLSDAFVLRDGSYAMRVEHGAIKNVLVCSAEQQNTSALQLRTAQ